jgi:hypothetical protein
MNDEQKITLPTKEDWEELSKRRAVIAELLSNEDDCGEYIDPSGKLAFLNALLELDVFEPTDTYQLQSMGVVLGDVFVEGLGFEWVMVEDDYGRDPAVRVPGTSILLFPLTMISKRIENGEAVDTIELFNAVAEKLEEIKAEGL